MRMPNTGKCPHCNKVLSEVKLEHINATLNPITGPIWHSASYVCPHCHSILSVQIDPVALKADTVKEVLKALGKKV
jgi:phage FluMu protein Com